MRFFCAAIGAAFLVFPAFAQEVHEGKNWRYCSTDAQCVLIEGPCSKTAVNVAYQNQLKEYYAAVSPKPKCIDTFWKPKELMARCYLGGCQSIPKSAGSSNQHKQGGGW